MILGKVTNPVRYIGGVTTTRVPLPAPVHPMCARMAGFAQPFDIDPASEVDAQAATTELAPVEAEANPWRPLSEDSDLGRGIEVGCPGGWGAWMWRYAEPQQ